MGIARRLLRIVYPERCPNCGEIIPIEKKCCSCSDGAIVTVDENACQSCGYSVDECCCDKNALVLTHITAPFIYTGAVKTRILDFKFNGKKREKDFFAAHMCERFARIFPLAAPDVVTFVPMTAQDEKIRGYNQSALLAAQVSRLLMIPFVHALDKTHQTPSQHNLPKEQRENNLVGAFSITDNALVRDRVILLCDDIKTTGTTLFRCGEVLLGAGAKDVYCLCAALADHAAQLNF